MNQVTEQAAAELSALARVRHGVLEEVPLLLSLPEGLT
jgi:hypothetical protein